MATAEKIEVRLEGNTKDFTLAFKEAGEVAEKTAKKIKGTTNAAGKLKTTFRSAANATSILNGPLNGISGRLSSLSSAFGTLSPALIASGVSFSALTAVVGKSMLAFADYESQMMRMESVLKATGGAAGLTAEDLDDLSKQIGMNTLANADQVRDAAIALTTFRSISGDTFKTTLSLAQDLSEVMRQDLKTSVMQLGKALEDPVTGLTALKRAGVSFNETQKETIRNMVESGRQAEAQALILAALAEQVGGAGAGAAGGLTGKMDSLGESWRLFKETVGGSIIIQKSAAFGLDVLTASIEGLDSAVRKSTMEEYQADIKRISTALKSVEGLPDQGTGGMEDRVKKEMRAQLKVAEEGYAEALKQEEDHIADRFEAQRVGKAEQKKIQEEQLKEAAENRRKDTADFLLSQKSKALVAEQLALKVSGNLEAAEGIRYAREANKVKADRQKAIDQGKDTEEIKEAMRRREEALYTQHIANMAAIGEKREDELTAIEADFLKTQNAQHKAWEKSKEHAETTDKERLENKRDMYAAEADMVGSSFGLIAQFAAEGSRAQKAALIAEQSMALARASIYMYEAIANANKGDPYTKWAHIAMATTQGLAAIAGIAAVGVAHGGASYIPEESTYLLNRGERVLSPNQNKDLTNFMANGGSPTINIQNHGAKVDVNQNGNTIDMVIRAATDNVFAEFEAGGNRSRSFERRYGLARRAV